MLCITLDHGFQLHAIAPHRSFYESSEKGEFLPAHDSVPGFHYNGFVGKCTNKDGLLLDCVGFDVRACTCKPTLFM